MSKLTVSPLLNTPLSVFCSHFALVESAIASMLLNSMVNSLPLAYVTTQESNVVYQPILLETLFQDLRSAPCLSQWPLLFHLLFWFFSFPRSLSMGVGAPRSQPFNVCPIHVSDGMISSSIVALYTVHMLTTAKFMSVGLSPEFQLHACHPHLDI